MDNRCGSCARHLLERDTELARLQQILRDAADGDGRVTTFTGPAGIGKTQLVRSTSGLATEAGFRVLQARGSELEGDFAFGIVRQLFEPLLARSNETGGLFAGAAALAEPAVRGDATGAPAATSHAVLHGLYWLVSNLADHGPVLLAIDDAHDADPASVAFLRYLAPRLGDLRVALVLALRPEEVTERSSLLGLTQGERVEPLPLSIDAVATLVQDRFGDEADGAFKSACHEATAGNPFYLHALLDDLAARGIEPTAAEAVHVRRYAPETIARSVLARLRRAPADAGALAKAVAVLGDGADIRHAAPLARLPVEKALAAADTLVERGFLTRGRPLRFSHPIVRAVIYSSISHAQSDGDHRRAARLLAQDAAAADKIAAHLLVVEPRGDLWAVDLLQRAADDALRRGAADSAISFLRRALAEPPDNAFRSQLLQQLGSAEATVGRPEALEHLRRALELSTDPRERARVVQQLMMALGLAGAVAEGIDMLDLAIASVEATDRELGLELEGELVAAAVLDGRSAPTVRDRVAHLRPSISGDTPAERMFLSAIAIQDMVALVPVADVVHLAKRALPDRPPVDPAAVPQFLQTLYVLASADELELSDRLLRAAIGAARAAGSVFGVGITAAHRARVLYRTGSLRESEAEAFMALDLMNAINWSIGQAGALAYLLDVLVERGRVEAAERLLNETFPNPQLPVGLTFNSLVESRGRLRLAQSRQREALEDFLEYSRREEELCARNPAFSAWRSDASTALAALGELDEARRLAQEELELARRFGAPRAIGIALRACGLAGGERDGIRYLSEAVDTLEDSQARLEHARALTDLGSLLGRSGEPVAARELLRRGQARAHQCGAIGLRERAYHELRAAGGRPRRLEVTGVDALTPSERRVAVMAAEGRTNRDIGQGLFLSLKTVEMHLSHAFRKLEVQSRAQLVDALETNAVD